MKKPSMLEVATALIFVLILGGLLFPAIGTGRRERGKPEAKAAAADISAALKAYFTEYYKWPDFTGDGLFLDEKRQAQLLRTLQGKDEANNPRKIVFFEDRTARQRPGGRGRYFGGFSPETGALLDPQGNHYRIAIDADGDGQIDAPYSDDPHSKSILTSVIVWSLGKDGQQGAPANPHTSRGSDDILSWQ